MVNAIFSYNESRDSLPTNLSTYFNLPPIDPAANFRHFVPPNEDDTPPTLFEIKISSSTIPAPRFTRITNPKEFLIFADGSCLGNGAESAKAGWAFVYRPETTKAFVDSSIESMETLGFCSSRLENRGPTDKLELQTSNRAELRAVIGALQFRIWNGEGFKRLVIATDSSYVVDGATDWIKKWQRNGWRTTKRKAVKNRDLWEELIKELHKWSKSGFEVQFWHIPREFNSIADGLAKVAATREDVADWNAIMGVAC